MTIRPLGVLISIVAIALPIIWLPAIANNRDVIALFSQYLGLAALIAMAISQIISTRFAFVEWLFGGLDRSYVLHKWLGISAMVAILLHDVIDAEMDGLGAETLLVEVAETLGEVSLYGLLILVVITITTFIPYHLWRWSHRFMGLFFVMGALHYLFILKPFSNFDPIGLYVGTFCILGVLAFSYRLLPSSMRPSKSYTVSKIEESGTALAVTMTPTKKSLSYRAGQFAFVSFKESGIGEPHPFTISQAPNDSGEVRMTIARLGDYTSRLKSELKIGSLAKIEGPFGRFIQNSSTKPELWIAAGVGVTPFVAWAQSLNNAKNVHMIYCVSERASAIHLEELEKQAEALPNFRLSVHESKTDGRLNAAKISSILDENVSSMKVSFCGPKLLRESLQKNFAKMGLPQKSFHYEEFEIRSGIGVLKMVSFAFRSFKRLVAQ